MNDQGAAAAADRYGARAPSVRALDRGIRIGGPYPRAYWRFVASNWWVVVLATIVGTSVGVLAAWRSPTVYRSEAVVAAATSAIDPQDFGGVAEAAFATDTVLQPVIESLGLRTTPRELLANGNLSAVAVTDSAALRITARALDPHLASDLASAAASTFATVASDRAMGNFATFGPGGNPGAPEPGPMRQSALFGFLAGGLAGLVGLLIVSRMREPIITEEQLAHEVETEEVFVARVRRTLPRRLLPGASDWTIEPRGLVDAVWRAAGAAGTGDAGASVACVMVESAVGREPKVRAILRALEAAAPELPDDRRAFVGTSLAAQLLPEALASAPAVVALVVAGTSRRLVARMREEIRTAPGEKMRIGLLVR